MPLILPDAVARKVRPLANTPLNQILDELVAREVIHEMTVTAQIPPVPEATPLTPEQLESLKLHGFRSIFAQIAEALRTSGLCLTGTAVIPPHAGESLVVKIVVLKHPMLEQGAPGAKVQVSL